ncbi:MAG: hypothetical protein ACI3XQ_03030 [Eubacteriales bacterium]
MNKLKNTIYGLKQYTKQILTCVVVVWAAGAVIGVIYEFVRLAVSPEVASMDALYIYLAAPITAGLPSYIIPNLFLKKSEVETGRYYGEDVGKSSENTDEVKETILD